jgi:trans-aconitate 2-methyltransferase
MTTWDQAQYLKFGEQRTRAAEELLLRIPLMHAARVIDLGCGPGNSTALLRARWPNARLTGVDNSEDMLNRARQDYPELEWQQADVQAFRADGPADVLFANAVFQWLPAHETLFPALFERVAPGGVFAVQMPFNFEEPSHRAMRELPGPWAQRLAGVRALTPVASASFYYDLLAPHAQSVDIWQTTYQHVMADAHSIVEWVKGTGLRPYLDALDPSERAAYLRGYTEAIDQAYPVRTDGRRLFAFPRLFMVALR